jgi:hypothetical protein
MCTRFRNRKKSESLVKFLDCFALGEKGTGKGFLTVKVE